MLSQNILEHVIEVPWDYEDPQSEKLSVYAREIYRDGKENAPYIIYFQGGPGFPSPRPLSYSGWLGTLLDNYRVILLDQRGTGRSTHIDQSTPEYISTYHLSRLRADYIVRDAEVLREKLGIKKWAAYGQSFGGFCISTYISLFPDSIDHALITGGIPGIDNTADEIYHHTFNQLRKRSEIFYRRYPSVENAIRTVAAHLESHEEFLPSGERLTSRRFRTLGINLGREHGMQHLAYLLEAPFAGGRAQGNALSTDFLTKVHAEVSFARAPLYAAIHEFIYAQNSLVQWSAHYVREDHIGFEENLDPLNTDHPYYLTGEHIFPWHFDEDPALRPFKEVTHQLAIKDDWSKLYDTEVLKKADVPVAACVYHDDIFVPYELSMQAAQHFRDIRLLITNEHQHDGIHHAGQKILETLINKIREY